MRIALYRKQLTEKLEHLIVRSIMSPFRGASVGLHVCQNNKQYCLLITLPVLYQLVSLYAHYLVCRITESLCEHAHIFQQPVMEIVGTSQTNLPGIQ